MRKGKGEDTIRQVRRKATNSLAAIAIVINSSKGRQQHQKEGNWEHILISGIYPHFWLHISRYFWHLFYSPGDRVHNLAFLVHSLPSIPGHTFPRHTLISISLSIPFITFHYLLYLSLLRKTAPDLSLPDLLLIPICIPIAARDWDRFLIHF